MWVKRTTEAIPWSQPIASSEKCSVCTSWGKRTEDGDVEKGDISMLEFTTLSVGFVLRPAPALYHPFFLTLSTESYLSL